MSTPSWRALGPDHALVTEQGEPGDAAREHLVGGTQDALLVALGQHDVGARGPGPLDEVVLEHQRGDGALGGTDPVADERVELGVVGLVDERHGSPDLARGLGGDPPLDAVERGRDRHRPLTGRHDRQPHVEAVDQQVDLRRELEPTVEHDPGQRRQGVGVVREEHAEHDVVAVPRHDHGGTLEEPVDDVRHRHRRDDQAEALAVEQLGVTVHERAVAGRHEVGHGRRPQQRRTRAGPRPAPCRAAHAPRAARRRARPPAPG